MNYIVNNNIQTSADNNETFIGYSCDSNTAPFSNPFPTGINNPAGRDPELPANAAGRHTLRRCIW